MDPRARDRETRGVHGEDRNEIECFGDPSRFPGGTYGMGWRGVDIAAYHACAIDQDDYARCWGRNQEGQLGDGTIGNDDTPDAPVAAPAPSEIGRASCRERG